MKRGRRGLKNKSRTQKHKSRNVELGFAPLVASVIFSKFLDREMANDFAEGGKFRFPAKGGPGDLRCHDRDKLNNVYAIARGRTRCDRW